MPLTEQQRDPFVRMCTLANVENSHLSRSYYSN
jgi:hypothetical protein